MSHAQESIVGTFRLVILHILGVAFVAFGMYIALSGKYLWACPVPLIGALIFWRLRPWRRTKYHTPVI